MKLEGYMIRRLIIILVIAHCLFALGTVVTTFYMNGL